MRKKNQVASKFIFCFLFVALLMNVNVLAQEDDNKEKEQLEAIKNEINEIYNKRIEAELKKDNDHFNKMKAGADKIEKIKDDKEKNDEVDKYQKAHKGHYMKMMNSAGLNMNSILAHLKKKYADYLFSSPDGISIDIEKKIEIENRDVGINSYMNEDQNGIAGHMSGPNAAYDSPYPPIVEENAINLSRSKSVNCTLASGGSVSFWSPNSMRATSTAAIIGGCGAQGTLQYGFSSPSGVRYMKVVLSGSLRHTGVAVATGGVSVITTETRVKISIPSLSKTLYNNYLSKTKVAPLLWAASYEESKAFSGNVDVTSYKGKGVMINVTTHSWNISEFISSTSGNCQINLPTVKKVFERL